MPSPWDELERRIRARGVRVEERLALLAILRAEDADARLAERHARISRELADAHEAVRREALS